MALTPWEPCERTRTVRRLSPHQEVRTEPMQGRDISGKSLGSSWRPFVQVATPMESLILTRQPSDGSTCHLSNRPPGCRNVGFFLQRARKTRGPNTSGGATATHTAMGSPVRGICQGYLSRLTCRPVHRFAVAPPIKGGIVYVAGRPYARALIRGEYFTPTRTPLSLYKVAIFYCHCHRSRPFYVMPNMPKRPF